MNIVGGLAIPGNEIEIRAVRAQGAGGQNVNKVASAVHLRFDVRASSLPTYYKERLLAKSDQRITRDGIIIIKAQEYRTQEKNRLEALRRLQVLIRSVAISRKTRRPSRPSAGAREKRLESKTHRGRLKQLRRKVRL